MFFPQEKLPRLFDTIISLRQDEETIHFFRELAYPSPSLDSINKINTHFGISIPDSLVRFAQESNLFSAMFCSLGDNYDSPEHIILINAKYKETFAWSKGQKVSLGKKPSNLVIITRPVFTDCHCLDTILSEPETGEYSIRYWHPGLKENKGFIDKNFYHFISREISIMVKKLTHEQREVFESVLNDK